MFSEQLSTEAIEALKLVPLPDFFKIHASEILKGEVTPDDLRDRYEAAGANPGAVASVIGRLCKTYMSLRNKEPSRVLEIGSGTGSYLRELKLHWSDAAVQIYEIEEFWRIYNKLLTACDTPEASCTRFQQTPEGSIDFLHAHGVFVYLKPLDFCSYIREISRVCAPSGIIAFDIISFESFYPESWFISPHRYAQPLPENFVIDWARRHGLTHVESFKKPWLPTPTNYMVFQKG